MKRWLSFFTLVLLSSSAHAAPVVIDRTEASVNTSLILMSDIHKFRQTEKLRAQLDPLFSGTVVAQKGAAATDAEIVDFLIDEKLIQIQFPVTDSEVEQEIGSIQSGNHLDRAGLKEALTAQGFTFDDYFELIRSSTSKRNLIDRDIRSKVAISDDDVKNYFYNNLAKGESLPSAYRISIISVAAKSYKTGAAAKGVAAEALKDIRDGESFADVAKRVSDDPSASSGGDLGVLTDDQISGEIKTQIHKLKVGQVSDVFGNGKTGYMILKLLETHGAEGDRLEKMKEEIRSQLSAAEFQRQISLWLERERQTAFIHKKG